MFLMQVDGSGNWYYATWPEVQETLTQMKLFNNNMTTDPWPEFPEIPLEILPKDYVPASYRKYYGRTPDKGIVWVVELKEIVAFDEVKKEVEKSGTNWPVAILLGVGGLFLAGVVLSHLGKSKRKRR